MHLVQLLLPLRDAAGAPFPSAHYREVARLLAERFGGMTAYTRAPAEGVWREGDEPPARDDIVVYEVMVRTLERDWWMSWREDLQRRFAQD